MHLQCVPARQLSPMQTLPAPPTARWALCAAQHVRKALLGLPLQCAKQTPAGNPSMGHAQGVRDPNIALPHTAPPWQCGLYRSGRTCHKPGPNFIQTTELHTATSVCGCSGMNLACPYFFWYMPCILFARVNHGVWMGQGCIHT
jgi:hypothetical protein